MLYIKIRDFTKIKNVYVMLLLLYIAIISVLMWSFSVFLWGSLFSFVMLKMVDLLFPENRTSMYKLAAGSWMIGMAVCVVLYYCYLVINGEPYAMSDDFLFDRYWADLCIDNGYYTVKQMIKNSEFTNHNSVGYVLMITYLQRISEFVGGYHTLIPRILNITLLDVSALVAARIATNCWGISESEEKKIFQWISLFPNCMYICSHIYRDMLVSFFVLLIFYLWLGFRKKTILQKGVIIILTLFIMGITYFIREFVILIQAIVIFLNFIDFNSKEHSKIHTVKRMMKYACCVLIFIAICIVFNDKLRHILHEMYGYSVRWSRILGSRFQAALSGLGNNLVVSTLVKCVYYILTPMNGQLFNPFLWTSFLDLILSIITIGTFATFFLMPYVIKRLARLDNVAITFLVIYISTAATTTGFRHILLCYPYFFMLGVVGKSEVSENVRHDNKVVVTWAICAFIFVYYVVRIGSAII